MLDVDRGVRSHFLCQLQTVLVHVRDDHAARARVFADAGGDDADGPRAGDQHVLSDQREHERRVRGVADGVKEGHDLLRQALVDDDDVARGDADIFGKGAVAVHADADVILAPLDVARMAVAAAAAGDMPLAADALAHVKAGDARAQRGDLADIFVAYDLRRPDVLLRPGIPFVNVNVRTADCGLMYLDQHLARRGNRHRYPAKLQPLRGGGLDDGVHPCLHDNPSNIDTCVLYTETI